MKTTQKVSIRQDVLCGFPKFAIPPALLVLREMELMEKAERFGSLSRPRYLQRRRG
jgi:hypothetical protein